jgi:hypothetical protein
MKRLIDFYPQIYFKRASGFTIIALIAMLIFYLASERIAGNHSKTIDIYNLICRIFNIVPAKNDLCIFPQGGKNPPDSTVIY